MSAASLRGVSVALIGVFVAGCSGGLKDERGIGSADAGAPALRRPPTGMPTLAARDTPAAAREKAALAILHGDTDARLLAVEATEPGQTLDTSLRDRLSPRTTPPSVRMGAIAVTGRLPPEVIQRIVRFNFSQLRGCYEQGLARDPELAGTVEVRFTIGPDGSVTNVTDPGSDLKDPGVRTCLRFAFSRLSFPAPESGFVAVTYPIRLSPTI